MMNLDSFLNGLIKFFKESKTDIEIININDFFTVIIIIIIIFISVDFGPLLIIIKIIYIRMFNNHMPLYTLNIHF